MACFDKSMYFIDMDCGFELSEISRIATTYCSPDWQWDHIGKKGVQESCFLWLVMAGRGELLEGGRLHQVGIGDCLLMPVSEDKRGRHDPGNPLIVSWAELVIVDRVNRKPITGPQHVRLDRLRFLGDLFSRASSACRKDGNTSEVGRLWMRCLLEELFQLEDKPSLKVVSHYAEAIDALCGEIRRSSARHDSIAQMARKLHVSVDHFIRLFKQVRGVTPGEFVVSARLETASSLLLFTRRTVSQIADELGYCDAFHFSKQFKMRMGVSPLAYRRGGAR